MAFSPFAYLFRLILSALLMVFICSEEIIISSSEMTALEFIFNSTDGNNWKWVPDAGPHWTFNPSVTSPCADGTTSFWQGINCSCSSNGTAKFCNIVGINLKKYALFGTIPPQINLLTDLTDLTLSDNFLFGTELNFLCQLPVLELLGFKSAGLGGTIPSCIAQVSSLYHLELAYNLLTGALPSSVGSLPRLTFLSFPFNERLTGSLPSALCLLDPLQRLDLGGNQFEGTVPTCLGQLSSLTFMALNVNRLGGTLSAELFMPPDLQTVLLDFNSFSGTVPNTLWQLSGLLSLGLRHNNLTGTLPLLVPLTLNSIWAGNNNFEGTIPTSFGSASALSQLQLDRNRLDSTIPESLGLLPHLYYFSVSHNNLVGMMPGTFGGATALSYLYVANNTLEGTGEDVLGFLSVSVTNLDISHNKFSGQFPFGASGKGLVNLYIRGNSFSGSIPTDLPMLTGVDKLDISLNKFTGTLPSELALTMGSNWILGDTTAKKVLLIAGNKFHGDLNIAFPNEIAEIFVSVDLERNGFSGQLPSAILSSKSLEEFIGGINCFSGAIPSYICSARSLKTLDLSGMTSGSKCVTKIGKATHATTVPGDIPSCLLSSRSLVVLTLSGNGIRSKLSDIPANSNLTNVSLSYNRITGTIPDSVLQYQGFRKLDLSYNHLSGTLEASTWFQNESGHRNNSKYLALRLKSNRLSGHIPSAFSVATNISIVAGNMFQCLTTASLPQNDPDVHKYFCGSEYLDSAVIAAAALMMFLLLSTINGIKNVFGDSIRKCCGDVVAVFLWRPQSPTGTETPVTSTHLGNECVDERDNSAVFSGNSRPKSLKFVGLSAEQHTRGTVIELRMMLYCFRRYLGLLLCAILVVFIPVYLALKYSSSGEYSSQTYQYGWLVSMGFMQYELPAATIFSLWFLLLPGFLVFDEYICKDFRYKAKYSSHLGMGAPETELVARWSSSCIVLATLANLAVVGLVNGWYVRTVLYGSAGMQSKVLYVTSMFKTFWSQGVMNPLLRMLKSRKGVLLAVTILNSIIIPILVTSAIDINCYQKVFVPGEPVTEEFVVNRYSCAVNVDLQFMDQNTTCVDTAKVLIPSFTPPYVYSGQCSNSLLSNYIPVYLLTYGVLNMTLLVLQFVVLACFTDVVADPNGNLAERWLYEFKVTNQERKRWCCTWWSHCPWPSCFCMTNLSFYQYLSFGVINFRVLPISVSAGESLEVFNSPGGVSMYKLREMSISMIVAMLLLVSYGVAYPLLAIVLVANCVLLSLVREVCIYRHYDQVKSCDAIRRQWYEALILEMDQVKTILFSQKSGLVLLVPIFIAIFLYDMTSYQGSGPAIVFGAILCAWGAILALLHRFYRKHERDRAMKRSVTRTSSMIKSVMPLMWPTPPTGSEESVLSGTELVTVVNPLAEKSTGGNTAGNSAASVL